MSAVSSTHNFWIGVGISACVLGIFCIAIAKERYDDRQEAHAMEQCHEVDGRDYEGCLVREMKEYEE